MRLEISDLLSPPLSPFFSTRSPSTFHLEVCHRLRARELSLVRSAPLLFEREFFFTT